MMKSDLPKISNFLFSLNLQLAIHKTKFILFANKNAPSSKIQFIDFNSQKIERVYEIKYLGIIFDDRLCWKQHVISVAKKISPYIGMIKSIRHVVSKKILMSIYYAYIHSRFTYGLPVWQSASAELRSQIQVLQNKAVKLIRFLPILTPTISLYGDSFLSFLNLIKYENIFFIYKIRYGLLKSDNALITGSQVMSRTTRQSNLLRRPAFSTSISQSSIFYFGIILYNGFMSHLICNSLHIEELKLSELKTHLRNYCSST